MFFCNKNQLFKFHCMRKIYPFQEIAQSPTWYCEEEPQNINSNKTSDIRAFSSNFRKRPPGQNWEKKIDLTSKLGEINNIEHYKGSKIYPQNQVILDCIMPSIPLNHKCLSIILIWVSVSHKLVPAVLKNQVKKKNFFLIFLIGKIRHGIWKKGGYF